MPPEELVVYGYHGTTPEAAESILAASDPTTRFRASFNRQDWLGDGVYFFQDAPERARLWPTLRLPVHTRSSEAVVIGARINLKQCLDLLDVEARLTFWQHYTNLLLDFSKRRVRIPRNRGGARYFDRELINFVVDSTV